MIASHSAFSDTAERHLAGGEVDDGIVDAAAAKMASGKDFLFGSRIFGEKIECKRVWMGFDLPDCIIQVRIGKYRKNRSENFSPMTGSSQVTSFRMVGAMRRADGSDSPPQTSLSAAIRFCSR